MNTMTTTTFSRIAALTLLVLAGITLLSFINPDGLGVQHVGASGETAVATCTVVVGAPTANIDNNGPVPLGGSATLTWSSTNASTCTGTGFSTGNATSGSVSTGPLTSNTNYSVSCSGATDSTTVAVYDPSVDITASPDRVSKGASTQVSWTSNLVSDCTITRNGAAFATGLTGTNVVATNVTAQTVFAASCDDGAATDSVIVNIVPKFEEF